jgi:hypothetical protein
MISTEGHSNFVHLSLLFFFLIVIRVLNMGISKYLTVSPIYSTVKIGFMIKNKAKNYLPIVRFNSMLVTL